MRIAGIHPIHRRLAEITLNARDKFGLLEVGEPELKLILPLLLLNQELIQKLDGLKNLAYHAHTVGDMDWLQDITRQIEEIEVNFN